MGLLDVEVVAAEAVALSIDAGVPEDQPVPPTTITEPPHPEIRSSRRRPYPIPQTRRKSNACRRSPASSGIGAFITGVLEALGKCPSWVPAILLSLAVLLTCWPR